MNSKNAHRSGVYIKQQTGYKAFLPNPLPPSPSLKLDEELATLLGEANLAIGRLAGLSSMIPDPNLFVYLYVRKEALLSSQIEGTQCSLEDILNPESDAIPNVNEGIEEVSNYVKAMNKGLSRLDTLPISTRLIKEMHAMLMKGVRGADKTPGEFRRSQNWIGRPGATLMSAEFVPPPPEEVNRLMSDLENFIHEENNITPLFKTALIHAQLETIHPFLDGNGRLGRLLITYLLCTWGVLDKPLLYISYYFKAYRTEYYTKLMAVRHNGDWESWVKFFLCAVRESAAMAVEAASEIYYLHLKHRKAIHDGNFSPTTILVFEQFCLEPILINSILVVRLESTKPTIQRALDGLVNMDIIREVSGKRRGRRYVYKEYLDILTRDTVSKVG